MKSIDEIQRAHDLLVGIFLDEVPNQFSEENKRAVRAQADVLCWILEHDHNTTFANNLRKVEASLRQQGFELRKEYHGHDPRE